MLRKARRWAKTRGKDIDDVLLGFIYSDELRPADRIACIKLWKDITVPKISEGGEADRSLVPALFLPEHHPALRVVSGGKGE